MELKRWCAIVSGIPSGPVPIHRWEARAAFPLLILLGLPIQPLMAQDFVAGRVLESGSQRPLGAAQIQVVGTSLGAITSAEGAFRIEGIREAEVQLRVSLLGYRSVTRTAQAGEVNIQIEMDQTALDLDAIVVTGVAGQTQRRAIGNAVARVSAEELLRESPIISTGELLQSRSPGVLIQPGTGMVGAGPRIRIRGQSSLSLGQNPLIYIDGVRVDNTTNEGPSFQGAAVGSRLNDLDPSQIESFEIIKGPAAATLYGTEAANGVIQIITKSGSAGQAPQFELITRQGVSWLNDAEGRFRTNYGIVDGQLDSINIIRRERELGRDVFTPGHQQGFTLSLRGGSEMVRYFLSAGGSRDEGAEPTNVGRRQNFLANLGVVARPSVNITGTVSFNRIDNDLPTQSSPAASVVASAQRARPHHAIGDDPRRGWMNQPPEVLWGLQRLRQIVSRTTMSLNVEHRPPQGRISQRLVLGMDVADVENVNERKHAPPEWAAFYSAAAARGFRSVQGRQGVTTTVDYSGSLHATLRPEFTTTTSLGVQYFNRINHLRSLVGNEFPAPGVQTISGAARTSASDNHVENTTLGTYLQQSFEWRNRLFWDAAIRVDNNSAFGAEFDLVTYPKLSASWVISEEDFFTSSWVDQLRIRAAYGASGQQPEDFAALRLFSPVTGTGDLPAVTTDAFGNPELAPERGQELEVGLEASVLGGRLMTELNLYHQKTKDVILLRNMAPSTGFGGTMQFVNAGTVQNRGLELLVDATLFRSARTTAGVGINLATNRDEILDLGGDTEILVGGETYQRVGFAPNSFFAQRVVSAEMDADGNPINVLCDGGTGRGGVEPGGAGVPCSGAPRVHLGNFVPDWSGSVRPHMEIMGGRLRMHALFDFQTGLRKFAADNWGVCSFYRACEINFRPEKYDPRVVAETEAGNMYSIYYNDASFTKLRELSLTYTLPASHAGRIGASAASITVSGRNLFTWTSWTVLDPESMEDGRSSGGGAVARYPDGRVHEQGLVPPLHSFQASVRLLF